MQTNKILFYSIAAGLFATLFIPFIIADSQFFPFITGKAFTFRILVEVMLVLWLALAFRDRSYAPKVSYILWTLAGFLVVIGAADLFGKLPYKSFWSNFERMEGYITLLHLAAYFVILSSVFIKEKIWTYFINTSIGASVIMALYGFLQLGGKIQINQGGVRVDGTLGNATYLAVYMLFHFFFTLWYFVKTKSIGARIFYGIAMIFQFIIIYNTGTRGTMLGLIGGLILTTLIIAIFEKTVPLVRKISIGTLVGLALIVGGFIALKDTQFVQNSPVLSRFATISFSEQALSSQGRYFIWPMAIEGFKERPILGWGQENFNYVFNEHYNPKMYNHEQWFDRTHNVILDWLIAGGILGLLGYISLFIALLYYIFRSTLSVREKAVIFGLIAGYTFHNLFVFDNLISYIFLFIILAYFHSIHAVQNKESIGIFKKLETQPYLGQAIVAVVAIGMIFVIYFANIKPILANRALIGAITPVPNGQEENLDYFEKVFSYNTFADAEASEQFLSNVGRFTNAQVPEETRARFAELATRELGNQVERKPDDARYQLFLGSINTRLGNFDAAIPALQKAVELSPGKQTMYFELGSAYLSKGDLENALASFKYAYELAPEYTDARLGYAAAAIVANEPELAEELLSAVPRRVVAFDERIFNAYILKKQFGKAIAMIETRIEEEPNNFNHWLLIAAAYLDNNQRAKSVEALRKAIELNPQFKEQGEYYIKEVQAGRNP